MFGGGDSDFRLLGYSEGKYEDKWSRSVLHFNLIFLLSKQFCAPKGKKLIRFIDYCGSE